VPGPLRLLRAAVAAVGVPYVATLVPGVRPGDGWDALWDGWAGHLFMGGVIALCLVRAARVREDRLPWVLFAAGLAFYVAGDLLYSLHYQWLETIPYPSGADVLWFCMYPCTFAALVGMFRTRVPRLPASTWLDGIVTGLTVAAFTVQVALGDALSGATGSVAAVATTVAYPLADLLLVVLIAGALTVIGRGAGGSWWWLSAGMSLFVVSDTLYAYETAHETYVAGTVTDLGWALAFGCFAVAASRRPNGGEGLRFQGAGVLVVPGTCALAALALLFQGYLTAGDSLAGGLALAAVLAALGRTALTFREVQALADSRRQARTDELTGLVNRRGVYEHLALLDGELGSAGDGAAAPVAVLLVDLDRFKEINDSLGHAAGDALLRQVGPRLAADLRAGDVLGRLGGDEFVVVARDLDADGAAALAARLRTRLQAPFRSGAMDLSVDASIGVAVGPAQSAQAEELLQLADLAMYSAKRRRLGVAVYDDARDGHGRHRFELAEQLRAGIADGQLVLHYQPKLALAEDAVVGVEALVRWAHPERGLLYPDAFIDVAESSGLMGELTLAVLDGALAQARRWADEGRALSVAVNVSPSNLVDDRFPEEVAERLAAHGLPASALELEVTESLLMEDRERAVSVLGRLREAGIGIAIDDYGTGYSSLAYLAELPVTELKLDRAFVAGMTASWRAESIVISTLHLAHALGLALVAEGVEDQETLDALAGLGCDVVQGYHLSRPLPAAAFEDWLDRREQQAALL
jgi:diguanylate cyclase (GGDEF)-like protein